ncbi:hypothetical protein VD0002_g6883 [Verticillium dahliae]|nr:hypothetical protein VD0002_g6883 [Verticillium dahliae]
MSNSTAFRSAPKTAADSRTVIPSTSETFGNAPYCNSF